MARVLIPTPLRQFTGRQDAVTVAGATVCCCCARRVARASISRMEEQLRPLSEVKEQPEMMDTLARLRQL